VLVQVLPVPVQEAVSQLAAQQAEVLLFSSRIR